VRVFIVAQMAFALTMYAAFVSGAIAFLCGATAPVDGLPEDLAPLPHAAVATSALRTRRNLAPWVR
jgi:hypothetical protein